MRQIILEKIVSTLQPLDFVLALWQGGSAAHGYTDEWSDLDIAVVVEVDTPLAKAEGILDSQNQLADAELLQHR
ncbi:MULTISPECIES: nucleotidyltransferase domain-containing protein [unclassified Microcoleus]|uniref:nucleotidyltransferase domain-containing protein n=1 Tax=unclassified Microcoleus TaxID=2642155 RepID=UPI002FCEECF3